MSGRQGRRQDLGRGSRGGGGGSSDSGGFGGRRTRRGGWSRGGRGSNNWGARDVEYESLNAPANGGGARAPEGYTEFKGRASGGRGSFRDGRGRSGAGRYARGGGRGRGRYSNVEGEMSLQSKLKPKPDTSKKRNGEKGADSHTVSESDRIRLTKILLTFRDSEEDELAFPPNFTNTERKFVHELASQLGLISKSTGKGEDRHITVRRKNNSTKSVHAEDEKLPKLTLHPRAVQALQTHIHAHPPSDAEIMESNETGSSLALGGEDDDGALIKRLGELGLGPATNTANISQKHVRPIDRNRRRRYHANAQQKKKASEPKYSERLRRRAVLPAYAHQDEVVETVRNHAVTIISGETGCGKSTQVPQFLLDANPEASIVVTQPRRISAIAIAERVAYEQCISENELGGLIGYQVRLEGAISRDTQLVFCTPGILLRKLQSDPTLSEYTHICIDEVHERDKYTEFLLIALRDLLLTRPELRLILMSATLQIETLVNYFNEYAVPEDSSISLAPCLIEMEGRTFPVQEFFLETVLQMTGYIDPSTVVESGAVEEERLEESLAALLGNQVTSDPAVKDDQGGKRETELSEEFLCVMCGKNGFRNAMELAVHVAMCDGAYRGVDGEDDGSDDDGGDVPIASERKPASVEEYCEYDVEDSVEYNMKSFQVAQAKKAGENSGSKESKSGKWDGLGNFEIDLPSVDETKLSATEDALLTHYQSMHDDELVDSALLIELLLYIVRSSRTEDAILVFLPGWAEISEIQMLLEETPPFHNQSKYLILPLHSGIPSQNQRKVLKPPPSGMRKIVLSTNIAETSLTIDDISFCVDSGRAKEKSYDPFLKTSTLETEWVSRASAKQRKGRAGRTKAGVCFHLFSTRRHDSMRQFVESELLRTPLEEMCLMCKKLGLAPGGPEDDDGIPAFLSKAMSTPHDKSVANALELLVEIGAMQPETNALTHLGECLSVMSLEPRVGKMVIWSYLLGCSRTACNMGVGMSYKSPFILPPPSKRKEADSAKVRLSLGSESDQITMHYVLEKVDRMRNSGEMFGFCRQNYLGSNTLRMIADIRRNLTRELKSLGFPDPTRKGQYHNRCDLEPAAWQASLAAGMYPNLATRRQGDVNFSSQTNQKIKVHVSSVNAVGGQPFNSKSKARKGAIELMCYGELTRGARFFTANQTTHLESPVPLLLLCGTLLSVRPLSEETQEAVLSLDDWIQYRCHPQVASCISILRKRLHSAFWTAVADPSKGLANLTSAERDAVGCMGQLLRNSLDISNARR